MEKSEIRVLLRHYLMRNFKVAKAAKEILYFLLKQNSLPSSAKMIQKTLFITKDSTK